MLLSFDVERKRMPCLYDPSYRGIVGDSPPILVFRVHRDLARKRNKKPIVLIDALKSKHGFTKFSWFGPKYFGFDNAIRIIRPADDSEKYVELVVELVPYRKETDEPCKECKGTGWSDDFDRECSFCEGTKHKFVYDGWKKLNAISASLQILFSMAEVFDHPIETDRQQLLTIQVFAGKEMGGSPVWGAYGIDFCLWLSRLTAVNDRVQFNGVIGAMKEVYTFLHKRGTDHWDFQAYCEKNAWLIITVPGDACGLHPCDSYSWKRGEEGREFSCHNMDNPMQQIMCIVALAVLNGMARESMKG